MAEKIITVLRFRCNFVSFHGFGFFLRCRPAIPSPLLPVPLSCPDATKKLSMTLSRKMICTFCAFARKYKYQHDKVPRDVIRLEVVGHESRFTPSKRVKRLAEPSAERNSVQPIGT